MVIVDASVAIKWVITEPYSDSAALLVGQDLAAPELWLAEVANALWVRQARGLLTVEEARLCLRELLAAPVEALPMADLVPVALDAAVALRHPAYDCCYLAAAKVHGCTLVTADGRLARRVARHPEFAPRVRLLWDLS